MVNRLLLVVKGKRHCKNSNCTTHDKFSLGSLQELSILGQLSLYILIRPFILFSKIDSENKQRNEKTQEGKGKKSIK